MQEEMGKLLIGMDAIEDYTGRNKRTIRKWVEQNNFPAIKIDGRWESNTALIDQWRLRRIKAAQSTN